jgi:hypothetical protein
MEAVFNLRIMRRLFSGSYNQGHMAMTIWYSQGFVTAPLGPDNGPDALGYDNGGFFGPAFANLAGEPFLATWTGVDCNCFVGLGNPPQGPVSGAILTINGISLDLNAQHNIGLSAWLDQPQGLLLKTLWQQLGFPAGVFYGTQYTLATGQLYANGQGTGVAYLLDINHKFPTNLQLTVSHIGPTAVPLPAMDSGLPGLLALTLIGCWLWWRRHERRTASC